VPSGRLAHAAGDVTGPAPAACRRRSSNCWTARSPDGTEPVSVGGIPSAQLQPDRRPASARQAPGFNPTAPGFNPTAPGFNPTVLGFNPTALGFNATALGFSPTGARL
jgi:hypothetical protein